MAHLAQVRLRKKVRFVCHVFQHAILCVCVFCLTLVYPTVYVCRVYVWMYFLYHAFPLLNIWFIYFSYNNFVLPQKCSSSSVIFHSFACFKKAFSLSFPVGFDSVCAGIFCQKKKKLKCICQTNFYISVHQQYVQQTSTHYFRSNSLTMHFRGVKPASIKNHSA